MRLVFKRSENSRFNAQIRQPASVKQPEHIKCIVLVNTPSSGSYWQYVKKWDATWNIFITIFILQKCMHPLHHIRVINCIFFTPWLSIWTLLMLVCCSITAWSSKSHQQTPLHCTTSINAGHLQHRIKQVAFREMILSLKWSQTVSIVFI